MKIRQATAEDFEIIYADMLSQFPSSEMKTKEAFEALMKSSDYSACAIEDGRKMVGYFFAYVVRETNIVLLDHFAILANYHSNGYGSSALDLIQARYVLTKGIMIEVEKPNPLDENTLRRIKFYKSAGAYKIDMDYMLPSMDGATPMDLYFINCGGFQGRINRSEIEDTLKAIFQRVHASFANARQVWSILERSYSK